MKRFEFMVKFRCMKYTRMGSVYVKEVPFETHLSLTDACAEMVACNNAESEKGGDGIYYLDEECRVKTTDDRFEALWYPNTQSRA